MLWIPTVLIAVVSNLDNLAVGVAFGMRGTKISATPNLIIAGVTMTATFVAITSGRALSGSLPSPLASALGSVIIIAIGVWTMVASFSQLGASGLRASRRGPELSGDVNREIRLRSALGLGIALSLNNLGAGVGAGVAGIPPLAATGLAGVFSLLAVGGGSHLGSSLGRVVLGPRAPLIAGVGLVAIGAVMVPGVR